MNRSIDRRTGLVLSGGASNGAYEAGVLSALLRGRSPTTGYRPLDPDVLTGTSVGAYNAALLTSRLQLETSEAVADHLENIWLNVIPRDDSTAHNSVYRVRCDPLEYANPSYFVRHPLGPVGPAARDAGFLLSDWFERGVSFFTGGGSLEQRAVRLVDFSTLISREPSRRLFSETIDSDNILRSRRELIVTASDWDCGMVRLFQNGDMTGDRAVRIILASSALPGIFPRVEIDGEYYVDGGLLLNTPLAPAILQGQADDLHVIYVDPEVTTIPVPDIPNTVDTLSRMFTIIFASQMNLGIEIARGSQPGDSNGPRRLSESHNVAAMTPGDMRTEFLEWAPRLDLTIHRYRPGQILGDDLEMLNFSRDRMHRLLQTGYQDAVNHDCEASGCIITN